MKLAKMALAFGHPPRSTRPKAVTTTSACATRAAKSVRHGTDKLFICGWIGEIGWPNFAACDHDADQTRVPLLQTTSTGDRVVDLVKQIRSYHFARHAGRPAFRDRVMSNIAFEDCAFNV